MAERIVNVTCPNCKHGIKHDTLTGKTSVTPPEEYPTMNDAGRCWCKMDQRGTYPTKEGLCTDCLIKGIETRLRPKIEKSVVEEKVVEEEDYDLRDELTIKKTTQTTTPSSKPTTKKKPKVLR